MENGGYTICKLTEDIFLINGFVNDCCMYAVKGKEKLLLIDTGMGSGNLNEALNAIAPGLPVMVVNTHCHSDHCCGNRQFPEVHLHPLCYADAAFAEHEKKTLESAPQTEGCACYDWKRIPVKEGALFDLGGKTLKVIETPGHTPGDISLIAVEDKIVFVGDLLGGKEHCLHMLAYVEFFEFSTVSVETYLTSLKKLRQLDDQYERILAGHETKFLGKEYPEQTIEMCEDILSGTKKAYRPRLPAFYGCTSCWKYETEDTAMIYQDEVIRNYVWPKELLHNARMVGDGVTLLYDAGPECCCYLIEGSEGALVIDTGLGAVNMRREVELLTKLPYQVVNTHGHGDHSGGDFYFDSVWIHHGDLELAKDFLRLNRTMLDEATVREIKQRMEVSKTEYRTLHDGDVFSLGDRTVTVLEIPGHSAGSVALLDSKTRLLFTGDLAVRTMDILLTVPSALTLRTYAISLEKLMQYRDRFDAIRTGHDVHTLPADFLDDVLLLSKKIISGEVVGEDVLLPPVFGEREAKRAQGTGFAISYRENKI